MFSGFLLGKHHRKTVTHGHTHQPRARGAHTWPSTGCHGAAHTAITGEMPDAQNQAPPPAHAAGSGLSPQPSLLQLSTAVRGGQVGGRDEGYPDVFLHLVESPQPPTSLLRAYQKKPAKVGLNKIQNLIIPNMHSYHLKSLVTQRLRPGGEGGNRG